jgi:uncharacterized membrane protein YphA (DoxX/SURF4 family)
MTLPRPVLVLRLALALVMGWGGLRLALDVHAAAMHGGLHPLLLTGLGIAEALAAILFLIPATLRAGAWLLACCLVFATLLHLHTGEPPSPVFLVYAAGIWTVATNAA